LAKKRQIADYDESKLRISKPDPVAAGARGVVVAAERALPRDGVARTARTWLTMNQVGGFDCMSCAWPDPDPGQRHPAEFCENGAKAVAEEATEDRATPEFFAAHSIAEMDCHSEYWLGQQGRITHPMVKRPGATHYAPIGWDEAFELIAAELQGLSSPNQATFYTSGRASNEAAFAYQLFARAFGTNNLPDCSNMCHESTSVALAESIGIGKASVVMPTSSRPICSSSPDTIRAPTIPACSRTWRSRSGAARRSSPSTRSKRPGSPGSRTRRAHEMSSAAASGWPIFTCR
jgi:formate dehydrogenase major subunit